MVQPRTGGAAPEPRGGSRAAVAGQKTAKYRVERERWSASERPTTLDTSREGPTVVSAGAPRDYWRSCSVRPNMGHRGQPRVCPAPVRPRGGGAHSVHAENGQSALR